MTTIAPTPASSAPTLPANPSSASRQSESKSNPFQQMLSDEIKGKAPNAAQSGERNAEPSASDKNTSAAQPEKPAGSANTVDSKNPAKISEETNKEETVDTAVPMLSPELAAMVANLLQRQNAASAESVSAEDSETVESDPLALLTKAHPRQGQADMQMKDNATQEDADARFAPVVERAPQSAPQTNNSAKPELDLQAGLAGKQRAPEAANKDTQTSDFHSMLQQMNQAQQAAPARSTQQPAQAHIAPRVGTQGWDQALGQRMVWMANGAEQSASLTLNPPELGPLQVTLNVSNNQANATFLAPHADVRQALEAALPKLREMLGEVGIQLDQASVGQGMPQQQGDFARSDSRGGSQSGSHGSGEPLLAEAEVTMRSVKSGNGLVDTFA